MSHLVSAPSSFSHFARVKMEPGVRGIGPGGVGTEARGWGSGAETGNPRGLGGRGVSPAGQPLQKGAQPSEPLVFSPRPALPAPDPPGMPDVLSSDTRKMGHPLLQHPPRAVAEDSVYGLPTPIPSSPYVHGGRRYPPRQPEGASGPSASDCVDKLRPKVLMPADPQLWTRLEVQRWLEYVTREPGLQGLDRQRLGQLDGRSLCQLTRADLADLVGFYAADILYAHLTYVRKTQGLPPLGTEDYLERSMGGATPATPHPVSMWNHAPMGCPDSLAMQDQDFSKTSLVPYTSAGRPYGYPGSPYPGMGKQSMEPPAQDPYQMFGPTIRRLCNTGSGQIQLWQFLLELIADKSNANIIAWEGTNGEFKLVDPDEVARRWGERKSKPNMNYDKLSRALRYYYDKNIMTKVHGKRYAYKFDFVGIKQAMQPPTPDPNQYRPQELLFSPYPPASVSFPSSYPPMPPASGAFLGSGGNYWSGHPPNVHYPNLQNHVLPNPNSHVTSHVGSLSTREVLGGEVEWRV